MAVVVGSGGAAGVMVMVVVAMEINVILWHFLPVFHSLFIRQVAKFSGASGPSTPAGG
jgi:hypothetical protein